MLVETWIRKYFVPDLPGFFFPKKLSTKLFMEMNSNGFIESSVPTVTLHITQVLPQRR